MNNELFEYEINDGSVTIVKYISNQADVVIPAEIDGYPVTRIGEKAFADCTFLASVVLPNENMDVADNAFDNCPNAAFYAAEPDGNNYSDEGDSIEDSFTYEFNGAGVTIVKYNGRQLVVNIPSEIDGKPVTIIGQNAFDGCAFVQAVNLPDTVTFIDKWAFAGCTSMSSIIIPDSVTRIDFDAFSNELISVALPDHPINTGNNFTNFKTALSSCGQKFLFKPYTPHMIACPRCGSTKCAIPESSFKFLGLFVLFLAVIFASFFAAYWDIIDRRFCSVLIIAGLALLFSEGSKLNAYLRFKSNVNKKLEKRKQACANNQSVNASPFEYNQGNSNSSNATSEQTANYSDGNYNQLQNPQDAPSEPQNSFQLPPLPVFEHSNPSLGCVYIPALCVFIPLLIAMVVLAFSRLPDSLLLLLFAGFFGLMIFFIIRQEFPVLKMKVDRNGIQCNRMKPKTLPWNSVCHIDFDTFPVLVFFVPTQTRLTLKINLKDGSQRTLTLRFSSEFEAIQSVKLINEYHRRSQFTPPQQ